MSKAEIQYFLMFIAGIAFFWVAGLAVPYLPVLSNSLAGIEGLVVTLAIYTLGFALLLLFTLGGHRSSKAIAITAAIVAVLALAAAKLIVVVGNGHIHSQVDLGLLTFVSYVLYGAFYVIGNTVAQRLAHA